MTNDELKDFEEDANLRGWTQRVWMNSDVLVLCAEIRRLRKALSDTIPALSIALEDLSDQYYQNKINEIKQVLGEENGNE